MCWIGVNGRMPVVQEVSLQKNFESSEEARSYALGSLVHFAECPAHVTRPASRPPNHQPRSPLSICTASALQLTVTASTRTPYPTAIILLGDLLSPSFPLSFLSLSSIPVCKACKGSQYRLFPHRLQALPRAAFSEASQEHYKTYCNHARQSGDPISCGHDVAHRCLQHTAHKISSMPARRSSDKLRLLTIYL